MEFWSSKGYTVILSDRTPPHQFNVVSLALRLCRDACHPLDCHRVRSRPHRLVHDICNSCSNSRKCGARSGLLGPWDLTRKWGWGWRIGHGIGAVIHSAQVRLEQVTHSQRPVTVPDRKSRPQVRNPRVLDCGVYSIHTYTYAQA